MCFGDLGVGARDEHAPLGVLRARGPHLLAVDDPLVAVLDRARLERRQVGAGLGLGEALAPDLVGGEDRVEVALLLLVGAPDHDRGTRQQQAEHVRRERRAGAAELLEEDRRLGHRRAAAAVLLGPVDAGPAAVGELALPVAQEAVANAVVLRVGRVARRVVGQPPPQLVAERELGVVECQVHGSPFDASRSQQPTSVSSRSVTSRPARSRARTSWSMPADSTNSASSGGTERPPRAKLLP